LELVVKRSLCAGLLSVVCVAALVVGVAQAPAIAGEYGLGADFNDTAKDAMPPGWSADTAGSAGSVGVAEVPDAVDHSLKVTKTATAGEVLATTAFGPLTGSVQLEARVRVEQTAGWYNVLYVAGSTRAPVASIAVRGGQFYDAGTGRYLAPVTAQRWYSLRVEIRTGPQRFDLFVDGQRVLADAPFRTGSADVGRVTVGVGDGYTGTIYADEVSARAVPDPSVDYVVLDQFNDTAAGASPAGYEVLSTGGSVSVVPVPSDADRGLLLNRTAAAGETKAIRHFAPQTGTVVVQANVRTDETAGIKSALYALSGTGIPAASVQFDNGWLRVFDAGGGHRLTAAAAKEWYTVRLVLDVAAQQYEVFIDGRRFTPAPYSKEQVAPRWAFRDTRATDVAALMAGTPVDRAGTMRLDNVMVYHNPVAAPPGPAVDVRHAPYNAVGDGITDNTEAIQRAVNDVPAGGSVVLSGGVFLTGTIRLKSNMTLWVDKSAALLGTWDESKYPLFDHPHDGTPSIGGIMRRALLLSVGADNLAIDGGGTIDGNGEKPEWYDDGGVDPATGQKRLLPTLMFLTTGENVSVRNVHVKHTAMWAVVLAEVDHALVSDVNIDNNIFGGRDGVDLVDTHDALVERVNVWSDDDAICFKSYVERGVDGATVRLSTVGHSERANGVKFGTASVGPYKNVVVEDVLVKHVDKAALTVTAVAGSVVSNVSYRRITVDGALRALFVLLGKRTEANVPPRWVSGVRFEGIVATNLVEPSAVSGELLDGTTYRIYNVLVSDVSQTVAGGVTKMPGEPVEYEGIYPESNYWTGNSKLPAYGYFFRHVNGVTIRGSTTVLKQADVRPVTAYRDALDVRTG
jgi:Glycosyl hydrolases family 28